MKKLIFLAIGIFSVGCSSFIIAGFLPKISQTLGHSIAVTAQGMTAFGVAYLFSAPLFSFIFNNKSVKPTIQFALILLVLGNLITCISNNITFFIIGRAMAGIGAGIFTPLCITIAVHSVRTSAKGRVLSFVWGINSAGVVFGVPFGLYLSSLYSWQISILFIVLLGLISLIGFSLQNFQVNLPKNPNLKDSLFLLYDLKVILIIGITCFTSIASLGLYSYVSQIQSGSLYSLALTLFIWGLGGFIGSSLIGIFIDRTNRPQMIMIIILVGLILSFITIPVSKGISYLELIPFFIWFFCGWAMTTPQQHLLFKLKEKQGTILALGFNQINLPFIAAALLVGVIIFQIFLIKNLNRSIINE